MTESGNKRERKRDAQRAREVIMDTAEAFFAEHGFDGARINAIAKASGYNISLLFQYFGDKLGLYTEVLKRIDKDLTDHQKRVIVPLLEHDAGAIHDQRFRTFLAVAVKTMFDYLLEHPNFLRILTWEMAEGWQTYQKIVSHLQREDTDHFEGLFRQAGKGGLLRSGFTPLIQLAMITPICQSFLAYLPLYQEMLPNEDISTKFALSRARDHLVTFIVAGMLVDPQEPNS